MALERRFRELKPEATESTIKTYSANIRRLRKLSPSMDYHTIAGYLKGLSSSVGRNLLTAVIVLEGRERFGPLFREFIEDAGMKRGTQTFTRAELANWSSSRAIRAGIARVKFDTQRLGLLQEKKHKPHLFQILQQYMVLKLYSEFHWRSDLPSVLIGRHHGKNYFVNGRFYLNHFKTAKHFERKGLLPLIFTPSRSLGQLLKKFLKIRSLQEPDHEFLMLNKSGRAFKRDTFYKYLTNLTFKYIGKKMGTSQLRKIYITEFLATNPSLKQKQAFMKGFMQLSLETQEGYRRINMPEE
jgi:hypothetical protein